MAAPISLEQAKHHARTLCSPLPVVHLSPQEAHGLFLAQDVDAPRDLPGCDNSAMDGYAVRAAETGGANRDRPCGLKVVETLYAGRAPTRTLGPGEAARIFTGAPVPEGADAVVRQEATRAQGTSTVEVVVEVSPGENIRRRGEETRQGQRVLQEGLRVDAAVAGVAASLGIATLAVRPRPKVAVLTVGDELLPPGAPALPHQIHDANGVMLSALCREAGAEVVTVTRAADTKEALAAALSPLLASAEVDMIVTAGGASVGDKDLVKRVLRELGGELRVDGVALKPGKPVGLSLVQGTPVVVLPGNPGAAMVGFDQLGRTLLLALQGVREVRRRVRAVIDAPRHKQPPMTYLMSARVDEDARGVRHARIRPQGAGQVLQNVGMEGWALFPPGRADFSSGEHIEVELLSGALHRPLVSRAVALVGWSGSGKTTRLLEVLPQLCRRGLRVAVVKHSSHHHTAAGAEAEAEEKDHDTARLREAGAAFCVLSTPAQAQSTEALVEDLRRDARFDLVLVEGWKDGPLPKVEVWREGLEPPLFTSRPEVFALVTDAEVPGAPRQLRTHQIAQLAAILSGA